MAVVYRYVGILTVDVIVFFQSPSVFHSQDSFPSMFRPRLWETSSGVVAVGVFAAEARRKLWACPSRLCLIYVVHAYCCGQHSDNWNLIGRFLYRCSLWSEVSLCTFLMPDTKVSVVRVLANHGAAVHMHHINKMQSRWTSSQFSVSLCSKHL